MLLLLGGVAVLAAGVGLVWFYVPWVGRNPSWLNSPLWDEVIALALTTCLTFGITMIVTGFIRLGSS